MAPGVVQTNEIEPHANLTRNNHYMRAILTWFFMFLLPKVHVLAVLLYVVLSSFFIYSVNHCGREILIALPLPFTSIHAVPVAVAVALAVAVPVPVPVPVVVVV